ncbi:hypothetical protein HYC85_024126 [Camellia sinensis]|uniref:Uncharacterized protein n=1 Tax=Camellia sinensis TaxID=4442 RepID=A0A7J7G768_CAMSI|nr:hypothetical protein HYC85_024126 [Camellia sinensis]
MHTKPKAFQAINCSKLPSYSKSYVSKATTTSLMQHGINFITILHAKLSKKSNTNNLA